jgi:hypothetical protein
MLGVVELSAHPSSIWSGLRYQEPPPFRENCCEFSLMPGHARQFQGTLSDDRVPPPGAA